MDRVQPDPSQLAERRRRVAEEQAVQRRLEAREQAASRPNIPLRLGGLMIAGGWIVVRQSRSVEEFSRSMDPSDGSSWGIALGWIIGGAGLVLLLAGLFNRNDER